MEPRSRGRSSCGRLNHSVLGSVRMRSIAGFHWRMRKSLEALCTLGMRTHAASELVKQHPWRISLSSHLKTQESVLP